MKVVWAHFVLDRLQHLHLPGWTWRSQLCHLHSICQGWTCRRQHRLHCSSWRSSSRSPDGLCRTEELQSWGAGQGSYHLLNIINSLFLQIWENYVQLVASILCVALIVALILINAIAGAKIFPSSDFSSIRDCHYSSLCWCFCQSLEE